MLSLHQAAVKLHDTTTQIHYNSLVTQLHYNSLVHIALRCALACSRSEELFSLHRFCSTPGMLSLAHSGPQLHPLPFSFSFLLLLSLSLPKKQSRRFFTHQFLLVRITFLLLLLLGFNSSHRLLKGRGWVFANQVELSFVFLVYLLVLRRAGASLSVDAFAA